MIRGLYTSSTGMMATQMQSEVVGDNIANLRTNGYKERLTSNISFPTLLIDRMVGNQVMGGSLISEARMGEMGVGVGVDRSTLSMVQGSFQTTDLKTDLALESPLGYFVVQTPEGERYTRNGHFTLNANGTLVTPEGYPVLSDSANGIIGSLSPDFAVSADGMVSDNGRIFGRIRVVDIQADDLIREGQSLYSSEQPAQPSNDMKIHQGMLEASNVSVSGQMVKMITIMRAYEANQRLLQTQDEMLSKAVNEIGKMG